MFREMPRETLINHQTFGSWLGEGNYDSIAAILSSLFHGSLPPGDKCVNYYISYPGFLLAAPSPHGFSSESFPAAQPWTEVTFAIKELFFGSHAERDTVISPAVCRL